MCNLYSITTNQEAIRDAAASQNPIDAASSERLEEGFSWKAAPSGNAITNHRAESVAPAPVHPIITADEEASTAAREDRVVRRARNRDLDAEEAAKRAAYLKRRAQWEAEQRERRAFVERDVHAGRELGFADQVIADQAKRERQRWLDADQARREQQRARDEARAEREGWITECRREMYAGPPAHPWRHHHRRAPAVRDHVAGVAGGEDGFLGFTFVNPIAPLGLLAHLP